MDNLFLYIWLGSLVFGFAALFFVGRLMAKHFEKKHAQRSKA